LNSVIVSLEEEFTALNNHYRKLLSTCSGAAGTKHTEQEAHDADELVTVIHKLHRKGEQLRKLRAGSPSMNLFSSSATATYVENMTNMNLAGGSRNTTASAIPHAQHAGSPAVTPHFIDPLPTTTTSHSHSHSDLNKSASSHGSAGSPGRVAGHAAGRALAQKPNHDHNPSISGGSFKRIKDDVLDFDLQDLNTPATIGSGTKN